ncbi:MAG TPA: hypothetical protein VFA85_05305 [Terriglobales bacterium]|nr:hypothetical protein [Terriglobales bacterium]
MSAVAVAGNPAWRDLYLAALFETNKTKIASRIETAEKAIIVRSRELFLSHANAGERNSLQSALVGLHALRSCVESGSMRNREAA